MIREEEVKFWDKSRNTKAASFFKLAAFFGAQNRT